MRKARNPTDRLAREIAALKKASRQRGPQIPYSSVDNHDGTSTTITQVINNSRPPETMLLEAGITDVPAVDPRTGLPVAVGTLIFNKAV